MDPRYQGFTGSRDQGFTGSRDTSSENSGHGDLGSLGDATPSALPDGLQRPGIGPTTRDLKNETYTIQWERGSPTLRVASGHTYVVSGVLSTVPQHLGTFLKALTMSGVTVARFSPGPPPHQLFFLTFSAGRHPHPDLGEVFLCDRPFLLAHRDVGGGRGF